MKPRTGLALFAVALLALLPATAAGADGPAPKPLFLSNSLVAQSSRAHALTFDAHGHVWFAGEATNYGPPFGIAGTIGNREALIEPAQAALAKGEPLAGIAAGPDGNLWLTSPGADQIFRMTPTGSLTSFPVAVPETTSAVLGGPTGIVAGTDGALWFTAEKGDAIGRITTTGEIAAFPLAPGSRPRAIVAAPDGELWFTESGAGEIGAITPAGTVATYPLLDSTAQPDGVAVGPEGEIWFTESNSPHTGVVEPTGQVVEFKAEAAGPIVLGPGGSLWFGSENGIGSITPQGRLGSTFCFDNCQADVEALAFGPEGLLWYAEHSVAHGGGGGNYQATETLAGSIGRYLPPFPDVIIAPRAKVAGRATVRIPLTCLGNAGESCRGKSRLRIDGHIVAVAGFSLPVRGTRALVLHLSPAAQRLLTVRGKVESKLYLTVPGNLRVMKTFTLRATPAHRGHAHRG
jgi:virginiamycin B lyase